MKTLDAAYEVLRQAGNPRDCHEIARQMLDLKIWETKSRNPAKIVYNILYDDISRFGDNSLFYRIDDRASEYYGFFNLRENHVTPRDQVRPFTRVDAAEYVLEHYGKNKPMHYADIADMAECLDLIQSRALDPGKTMYSAIHREVRRMTAQGHVARFEIYRDGMIGLQRWHLNPLTRVIEGHNHGIREDLKTLVADLDAVEFKKLIGYDLLPALGFEDVAVTPSPHEGEPDIQGTLIIGEVMRIQVAMQVKHWNKKEVQSPDIQKLRSALQHHEQGVFITFSDFSKGAIAEAKGQDEMPITLINGEQLLSLFIDHEVLTKQVSRTIIDLA
ncbi:restriction system protein [Methanofollis sp. W23]|uniref:HTH domain-containing protein n=1 Tax=Methanofollis sp. W23 TaxID=2817849 RepID=UPI001AE785BB|nr:HTH domain-containing protein [Methanofollis sp. W23]MBP2146097.1 restriction system protein [Methanofollis sp. W23]